VPHAQKESTTTAAVSIGDALTTASSDIRQFAPQGGQIDRKYIYALARQGQKEIGAIESCHLRRTLLRNKPARIPEASRPRRRLHALVETWPDAEFMQGVLAQLSCTAAQ
jgi:hypothetical protein